MEPDPDDGIGFCGGGSGGDYNCHRYTNRRPQILIEEQEIPSDFVKATVTSYAEQRLQSINQRLMSSNRLLDIIDRLDLYADMRDNVNDQEIVAKMREDTEIKPINEEIKDRSSGRSIEIAIAFTLSYEGKAPPEKVQEVVNELTSLILNENLPHADASDTGHRRVFGRRNEQGKTALEDLERRIAAYKRRKY